MSDLSRMSDSDLLAAIQATPDVGAMVTAEAQRQGVDPALALSVARAENGLRPSGISPKGAVGAMQLMPPTAAELGVDPNDLAQNIAGGVAYLKQQQDRFGDPRLAVAAYNAGPGAVQRAAGVPQNGETPAYVDKVMGDAAVGQMSDADLMAALGLPPAQNAPAPKAIVSTPQPARAQNPGGRAAAQGAGAQKPIAPSASQAVPGAQIGVDAASGFQSPFQKLAQDWTVAQAHQKQNGATIPKSIGDAVQREAQGLGDTGTLIGDAFGLFGAPAQAVLNPIAGLLARHGPQAYSAPTLALQNGKVAIKPARALSQPETQQALLGDLNTALSAARPIAPSAVPVKTPAPMTLDEVKAAKDAAYAAVDASGFRFPPTDVQNLAQTVANEVARKGGPKAAQLYPGAEAMSARLTALANQPGGVPLTQLDELRSDIYGSLVAPGDREAPVGRWMRGQIDNLINNSAAPNIAAARDLNTRVSKMQAVTDKLDSAGLRAASTYSGGNYNNAVRQNLRPLVDPTSAQQITNLTPQETAALRTAVQGTPTQNATRYATKLLTNKMVQAPVAVMTHGAGPAIMEAIGSILNRIGQGQTESAVQRVLDLMAQGGAKPVPMPPVNNALALAGRAPTPVLSPRGIFGLGVLSRPVQAKPAAQAAR